MQISFILKLVSKLKKKSTTLFCVAIKELKLDLIVSQSEVRKDFMK